MQDERFTPTSRRQSRHSWGFHGYAELAAQDARDSQTIISIRPSGTISGSATTTSSSRPTPSRARPGRSRSSASSCSTARSRRHRRPVALARSARAAEGHQAADGRGADPSPLSEDASAGRRARVLARAKYLYIGRDGRDVLWSFYNHHVNANDALVRRAERHARPCRCAASSGRRSTSSPISGAGWRSDGFPIWPFWENIRSWWAIRDLPNVKLHALQQAEGATCPGEMRRIARFLDIAHRRGRWDAIVDHCTFDYMKAPRRQERPARRRSVGRRCADLHQQGHQRPLARYLGRQRY